MSEAITPGSLRRRQERRERKRARLHREWREVVRDGALSFRCERCGVGPLERCVTKGGNDTDPHECRQGPVRRAVAFGMRLSEQLKLLEIEERDDRAKAYRLRLLND